MEGLTGATEDTCTRVACLDCGAERREGWYALGLMEGREPQAYVLSLSARALAGLYGSNSV